MPNKKEDYEIKEHQLFGATLPLWRKVRSENTIAEERKKKARKITLILRLLAPLRWMQHIFIRRRVLKRPLKDDAPIFVLGHWRSGTTHLHYILSKDKRFSHLGSFQAFFFNVAFISKRLLKPIMRLSMPAHRPQDNVQIDADSPQEEEHALVNITHMSGMHQFFFPTNRNYFDTYNCFDGISEKELKEWKTTYHNMLKEIAHFEGADKKLLLKNPHGTGRIKVLHEMYPKAKFIFIHRNPYDVFNSTCTLYEKAVSSQFLQTISDAKLHDLILHCYEKMTYTYLAYRSEIPEDQLLEIRYDDLLQQPMENMQKVYEQLSLKEFDAVKPEMQHYLDSVKNYRTNKKKEIPTDLKARINKRWKFAFEAFGYSIEN